MNLHWIERTNQEASFLKVKREGQSHPKKLLTSKIKKNFQNCYNSNSRGGGGCRSVFNSILMCNFKKDLCQSLLPPKVLHNEVVTTQLENKNLNIFDLSLVCLKSYTILLSFLRTDLIHQSFCRHILLSPEAVNIFWTTILLRFAYNKLLSLYFPATAQVTWIMVDSRPILLIKVIKIKAFSLLSYLKIDELHFLYV